MLKKSEQEQKGKSRILIEGDGNVAQLQLKSWPSLIGYDLNLADCGRLKLDYGTSMRRSIPRIATASLRIKAYAHT
jgi:hypothetical protein